MATGARVDGVERHTIRTGQSLTIAKHDDKRHECAGFDETPSGLIAGVDRQDGRDAHPKMGLDRVKNQRFLPDNYLLQYGADSVSLAAYALAADMAIKLQLLLTIANNT